MKILLGGLLVLSLALNAFLWIRISAQQNELKSLEASAREMEELRRQNEELQASRAAAQPVAGADVQELARLRNEIGQLRRQAAEGEAQRAKAEREVAQLRTQLGVATQRLTERGQTGDMTPEQVEQARQQAQATACINNLKLIGVAARVYANVHGNVLPPDFLSMRNELNNPRLLFCPAAPGGIQATDWSQLNPSSVSYQYLNPNGLAGDPQKVLTTCPIHGHTGMSDGSVQMGKK